MNQNIYNSHPSFSFGGNQLSIDAEMLEDFEKSYERYIKRSCGARIDEIEKKQQIEDLCKKTENLFQNLIGKSDRKIQKSFLKEIKDNINRVINHEFQLSGPDYSKKVHKKYISDADTESYLKNKYYVGKFKNFEKLLLEVMAFIALIRPKNNIKKGKLKREDLSKNGGSIVFLIKKYLNYLFKKYGALDFLGEIYGRKIAVIGLAVELSVPASDWWKDKIGVSTRPPNTLYCHIDESNRYPKSIVYLSDVGINNGPFSVYPSVLKKIKTTHLGNLTGKVIGKIGREETSELYEHFAKSYHQSMNSENFRKEFSLLPPEIQFNSHFGWDIVPETVLEEFISSQEKVIKGKSGTFCVFNGGDLLHRGGLVNNGRRIALQVIFG